MHETSQKHIYDAIIAAFCLISYSDGELHPAEMSRFLESTRGNDAFRNIDMDQIVADVSAMVAALDKDFKKGKEMALSKIAPMKNDFKLMDRIIRAARMTVIADGRIVEAEEAQLADIHRALGLSEEQ